MNSNYKIGIAIATHNSEAVIGRCLSNLSGREYTIVLFDDASTDRTLDIAKDVRPDVIVLAGDGNAWWAGGTARAVNKCFSLGCDFVLMLNPDAIISDQGVDRLVDYTSERQNVIAAGIVVRDDMEENIFWGGSKRVKLPGIPVYTNKYIFRKNTAMLNLDATPYATDEVHGRGVLISRQIYNKIGTLDWEEFPHYGADNDYSMRAISAGVDMAILPEVTVRLVVGNSGMELKSKTMSWSRILEVYNFLTKRKNGEYIRVLWRLNRRHTPWPGVVPSFLFNLIYVVFKKLF